QIKLHALQIWNCAIQYEYVGDFHLLPASGFPSINNGLEKVTSKSLYLRLCEYRPDLAGTEKLQAFFENKSLWSWTDANYFHVAPDRLFNRWYQDLLGMDNLLIHIAMRQKWSDILRKCMKLDKIKMLIFVGCRGHVHLFKTMLTDALNAGLSSNNLRLLVCNKILEVASEWGHLGIVKELVDNGYANGSESALVAASKNAHLDVVKLLSTLERTNLFPGFLSASSHGHVELNGHQQVVRILLQVNGINPSAQHNEALRMACTNGHLEVVKMLIPLPGVSVTCNQNEPIRQACFGGHYEIVQLLLGIRGVDASVRNNEAIGWAAENGHLQIVDLLLHLNNVDATARDNFAIRSAAAGGHRHVVEFLLQNTNADATAVDNEAIRLAARYGHVYTVMVLLDVDDVDVTAQNNYAFRYAAGNGHASVVYLLLQDPNVNVSANNDEGFRYACKNGKAEVVDILLKSGRVNPAAKNNYAIQAACKNGCLEVIKLLLNHGQVDATVLNNQPLRYAVQYGFLDVVKVLLEVGIVRARAKSVWGEITKIAVASGNKEMVQLLSEC
ncbi:hypothetical protein HDU76_007641, partial [Blyttiomyces sp. JEL0837]